MQIHCPNCGEKIRAENINIQEKVAVCSACDTVFKFEIPDEKAKRRKLKQPQNLILRDTDEKLQMSFRTNFRLDRDEAFILSSILGVVFTIAGSALFAQSLNGVDNIPMFFPAMFGFFALIAAYVMALGVYNHTEIEMDEEAIRVSRKPLPSLRNQAQEFQLSGIASITVEETPRSIKDAFDTPRYHVWAVYQDGSRKIIVADLIEDYAYFVAQTLEERLHSEEGIETSRLEDSLEDEGIVVDEVRSKTASSKS